MGTRRNIQPGERVTIECNEIEYVEGSDTIWIHDKRGVMILRIKVMERITSTFCTSPAVGSHADIVVQDASMNFCLGYGARWTEGSKQHYIRAPRTRLT